MKTTQTCRNLIRGINDTLTAEVTGIKLNGGTVDNLWFVDGTGILTRNRTELQYITTNRQTSGRFGLQFNAKKTETMATEKPKTHQWTVSIQEEATEQVDQFIYLFWRLLTANGNSEKDI